jgi:hypothetical protein
MNSYFELNIVRLQDDNAVYNDERVRFHALVEAEQEMLRISKNPYEFEQEAIFCFIIREIPFDQMCHSEDDILSERVYLPDGTKMDERLFPSGSLVGIFYGRLQNQIRFQPGQSVRVLDLAQKRVWTGFVYASPLLVEEVKRLYDDNLPTRLDDSDDSYVILDRPLSECKTDDDYMSSHSHISALRVFLND